MRRTELIALLKKWNKQRLKSPKCKLCSLVCLNKLAVSNLKMTNKLHTSLKTQEIFSSLGQSLNLQPFILSKLAIALSIRKGDLTPQDFETDNNGLELSRQVIFGDHDLLFRSLIVKNEGRVVREDDYFPDLVKAHLDRGAKLLENEKRYTKDFYNHLCRLDDNL